MNDTADNDPRLYAIPDIHGHAKGEHKAFTDERPIPLSARMLFLWFYHACRRGWPRFLMVTDHMNYLTFEDPAAINLVRRALKLAQAGDLYGAAETASVEVGHAAIVSEGLRRGMRYSIGAEVDNDPRSRPDAQNIVDAMKPDGMIRSVHFLTIDHPTHGPNWNWPFDNPEFADVYEVVGTSKTWELYMATLLDSIERLPGNILGHFYVPAIFGHWPDEAVLDEYENQIVDACEARGMAIEFNTRFLYRGHSDDEQGRYLAAHRRLLAKCKAKNVGIAVGSDAHSPKDQGRAFETVLALLDECEINELVFPIAGRLARVALRVERKVEPTPEPPPAEDRKAVRRARASDVSAVEEAEAHDTTPPVTVEEAAPAVKAKPRPRRSKAKSAETMAEAPIDIVQLESDDVRTEPLAQMVTSPDIDPIVVTPADEPAEVEALAASVESTTPVAPETVEAASVIAESVHAESIDGASKNAGPVETSEVEVAPVEIGSDDAESTADPVTSPEPISTELETGSAESITAERAGRSATNGVRAKAVPAGSLKAPAASAKSALKKTAKPASRGAKKAAPAAKKTASSAAKRPAAGKKAAPKKTAAKKAPAKKSAARTTTVKKASAKKTVAKKARPKKPQRRR